MRSARFELALDSLTLPEGGVSVLRPRMGDDLSALPKDRTVVVTGFRPDHDHFAAQGWTVARDVPADAATVIVCLPRARAHGQALLARAALADLAIVDGQKTDGIESALRDLRKRGEVSAPIIKAHGKLAWFRADLSDWTAQDRVVDGFHVAPAVFSADGPDRGSVLLAQALPALKGRVVDLGAGWGYLSRAAFDKGAAEVDLVEAEADALECARRNVPEGRFHWADATTFKPERPAHHVISNPPFHTGREADPALGAAFIRAAARMLVPDGAFWMVANRHLPYREVLAETFRQVEEVGGDSAFRVLCAKGPVRQRAAG
ncbi:class I SAM-dependent methyltransferase [Falsirhodobacter halotolerans]|uniref:class I SAM-dependent methyltransferase n=1 Tax=Falsirhodobacter halotolerans TaxID=1146892 RepID=UPI001FD15BAF|nr:methyltransferase [Falsirhodobacter halotolerans]MCJ8140492.1 methyltransferase [Falsirhodobacter halotolerans]